MTKMALLGAGMAIALITGCAHCPMTTPSRPTQIIPLEVLAVFSYPTSFVNQATVSHLTNESNFEVKRVDIPVALVVDYTTNSTIELDYYIPTSKKTPAKPLPVIMILPIAGGGYFLERFFSEYFVKRGFAVLIVRREAKKDRNPQNGVEANWMLRQGVANHRQVIDWIETRPELDRHKIGLMGTSMGGIRGAMLVAVDQRIHSAVLGLAGCDFPYMFTHSNERGLVKRRNEYLEKNHLTLTEFGEELARTVEWEPKNLAQYVQTEKVKLVLAAFDHAVPIKSGKMLKKLMGDPETEFILSGHYSALLYILYIESSARDFFERRFSSVGK